MALSKSFQRGQASMACQMCEESNEIKWKCLLCDFLLCTKCQTLHKKVKSTDQHTIIDIKDIATHQQQTKDKLDFSNIQCGIHAGQTCCLFCQSCKEVVCPLCITTIHDKHKMVELAKGYEQTMKTVKTYNSDIDKKLVQTIKVLSEFGVFKSSEDSKYELEKEKILSREMILMDEVKKHTNKLMKELHQRKESLMESVNDAEIRSEKIKTHLDFRKKNLSYALNSNNAYQVFSIYLEEKTSRNQNIEHVKTTFIKLPTFVPKQLEVKEFKFGSLVETNDDTKKQFEFKVIKQYKTKLPLLDNLVCSDDAGMWISGFPSKKLHQIKLTNESVFYLQTLKTDIYNMALLPSDDLLISSKDSNLKILSYKSSKVNPTKYSVNPLITLAVHVTSDHKILVGVRENQPEPYHVSGPRQVIRMSMDGKKENVYHKDNKGQRIFTIVRRITTDNDNNIYVIDILDEEQSGSIMALDKTNGVRWTYSGNPDINKELTFKPTSLVATKSDNIIVTDMSNNMIHIINTLGQGIHYIHTKGQLGIQLPYSVTNNIDSTGTLYIGCGTYKGEPDEAKIYTVQVSGF